MTKPSQPTRVAAWGLLLAYIGLGFLFAWRTPAWQAPDEPAHYNYIAQVAAGPFIPVIEMGDWDFAYLETLKANGFDPALLGDLDTVQYEDHQPPLYYWLGAPVYALTGGSLLALRLVSVLLGAITVWLTYQIGRRLWPDTPWVALAAMALVAFIPQNLHILSSVNNDALAGVWIALALWLLLRDEATPGWQLGLVLGLIVITKTTAYFMAGVVLVALVWRWRQGQAPTLRDLWARLWPVALAALPFALFWWGRNIAVYGFPDFLGLGAHDAVVVGQLRTAEAIAAQGFGAYVQGGLRTTYTSFWGQFGWMAAPLTAPVPWFYPVMLLLSAVALVGLAWHGLRHRQIAPATLVIFGAVIVLTALQFVYYNTTFVQFQGRYLFTALVPLALWFALGLDAWRRWLLGERAGAGWLTLAAVAWLALLDAYLIWRVIPGALS